MQRYRKDFTKPTAERLAAPAGHGKSDARHSRGGSGASSSVAPPARIDGMCPSCLEHARAHTEGRLRLMYWQSARALAAAVEAKDRYARAHTATVSNYAIELGARMKLPRARLTTLRLASFLHDIGKIGVPDAILQKPGPLTAAEFDVIKRHPRWATDILQHATFFADELPIILHHHEWYDGSGYPAGLAGESIPLEARILAVADALDAMFSYRSYKAGYSVRHVRRELTQCSDRQFDPEVVSVAIEWLDTDPERFIQGNSTQ